MEARLAVAQTKARPSRRVSALTYAVIEASSSGLHLVSIGSGTPVLVVHGGPGLDHQYLRPWLDPLARAAQLTFVDLRGHGRSERYPADPSMYSHAVWVSRLSSRVATFLSSKSKTPSWRWLRAGSHASKHE